MMRVVVFIIMMWLCYACGASRKVNENTDSRTVVKFSTVKIPEVKAELKVPMAQLATLPEGAAFVKREKHATATVRVVRDTLLVTAECDSISSVNYSYEQHDQKQIVEENVHSPPNKSGIGKALLSYLIIIAITIVATLIMRAKLN